MFGLVRLRRRENRVHHQVLLDNKLDELRRRTAFNGTLRFVTPRCFSKFTLDVNSSETLKAEEAQVLRVPNPNEAAVEDGTSGLNRDGTGLNPDGTRTEPPERPAGCVANLCGCSPTG
ncbi:unnamed protein product [Pleuronectes platessa]|uniref:Uncharacterized protein n=1 Tax=Pleuronectes platessa TaxID=8262 RepID=A0A9N7THN7_PLEPL|nr:unnamed protein product [Pleuronectes platessa]